MAAEEKELLRGGQFLVKETKCEDVFTPEDFSEEQMMMKEAVMEFNDREIIPHKARFEAKDYALTEESMRKAGALGFLGVSVPEAYGGLDMGFVSTMLVCDYISSGTGSFSTQVLVVMPILEKLLLNYQKMVNLIKLMGKKCGSLTQGSVKYL